MNNLNRITRKLRLNKYDERFKILIFQFMLEHNAIVCESKVKYWSRITPNNVNLVTNGILSLLHLIYK